MKYFSALKAKFRISVASVLAVVCKRMQELTTMLGPAVHPGKDTTHKTLETMFNARVGPNSVGRAVHKGPTLLRQTLAFTEQKNVGSCLLKRLTCFRLRATTPNSNSTTYSNMQQGVQTDATHSIQQCYE